LNFQISAYGSTNAERYAFKIVSLTPDGCGISAGAMTRSGRNSCAAHRAGVAIIRFISIRKLDPVRLSGRGEDHRMEALPDHQ